MSDLQSFDKKSRDMTAASRRQSVHSAWEKTKFEMSPLMLSQNLFHTQIRQSFSKNKTCAIAEDVIKENLLHYHVGMLLMISHLLVPLNFFSHFLLYGHSCQ